MQSKRTMNRHQLIGFAMIAASVAFMVLFNPLAVVRLFSSVVYFFISVFNVFKYLFISLFVNPDYQVINPIMPGITDSIVDGRFIIPTDIRIFLYQFKTYAILLFNLDNALDFLTSFINFISSLSRSIVLVPYFIAAIILMNFFYLSKKRHKGESSEDSPQLTKLKQFEEKRIRPFLTKFSSIIDYQKQHKRYYIITILVLLLSFNMLTILVDAVSFYLNFTTSLDLLTLIPFVGSILIDILPIILKINPTIMFIILFILFIVIREIDAKDMLSKIHEYNKEYVGDLGINILAYAQSGSGKTTFLASASQNAEEIIRNDQLLSIIIKYTLLFPKFDFAAAETWLSGLVEKETIVNRAQIKKAMKDKYIQYVKSNYDAKQFFGYNKEDGLLVNLGGKELHVFYAVQTYLEAYFLYNIPKPLIAGNINISTKYKIKEGPFNVYDYDYIKRDIKEKIEKRFTTVIDYDARRWGEKVDPMDATKWYMLDGIVEVYTELDKDYPNSKVMNIKYDGRDSNANPLNDNFSISLKYERHPETIDNQPVLRVLCDTQRTFSTQADLRDQFHDKLMIVDREDNFSALAFYDIEDALYSFMINLFTRFFKKYRNVRRKKTLYYYILLKLSSFFAKRKAFMETVYSYDELTFSHERGGSTEEEGEKGLEHYYLLHLQVFTDTFATDCYGDFFDNQRLGAKKGFIQAETFDSVKASVAKLRTMKSYGIMELDKYTDQNNAKGGIEY